jgi:hypothetical protein
MQGTMITSIDNNLNNDGGSKTNIFTLNCHLVLFHYSFDIPRKKLLEVPARIFQA